MADVVVVGRIGRDLVLCVAALPASGRSAHAGERRELLGGKGANQAVALARLGIPVTLVGVVGDDHSGDEACAQAPRTASTSPVSCAVPVRAPRCCSTWSRTAAGAGWSSPGGDGRRSRLVPRGLSRPVRVGARGE